ncbi:MAG: sigma-70 family RNA polymerase sigma factor [Myxococcales bacterium]
MPEKGGQVIESEVAVVEHVLTAGRQTFPTVILSRGAVSAHIARLMASGTLAGVPNHAADLYLATACAVGDATALAIIDAASFSRIPDFVARIDTGSDFAAEVAQIVRQKLFVGLPGATGGGKISEYSGLGPLGGWIRAVAVRVAIDLRRAQPFPGNHGDGDVTNLVAENANPEIALLRARYRDQFHDALNAAVATLSSRERNLLRFHFADGLTLDHLAATYRVHRATIARWLARARAQIVAGIKQHLADGAGLSGTEIASIVRALGNELDIHLSRMH